MSIKLPWPRYLVALERMKALIKGGLELVFWDDTTIGFKETHNSWGLCSIDKVAWPDAEDHLWPDQFVEHSRIAVLYFLNEQYCPFDLRAWDFDQEDTDTNGCFYRCMFFNPKGQPRPDRKQATTRYNLLIGRARRKIENSNEMISHAEWGDIITVAQSMLSHIFRRGKGN